MTINTAARRVKLTVIVPAYATSKTGPLTAGTVKEDGGASCRSPQASRQPSSFR